MATKVQAESFEGNFLQRKQVPRHTVAELWDAYVRAGTAPGRCSIGTTSWTRRICERPCARYLTIRQLLTLDQGPPTEKAAQYTLQRRDAR